MKMMLKYAICLVVCVMIADPASAQILRRLQQKATDAVERKVEQRVDREIEKAADKAVNNSFDAMFGAFDGSGSADGKGGKMPFSLGADVKTENRYTFDVVTRSEIEYFENDKSSGTVNMDMYFNSKELYTGTKMASEELKQSGSDVFIVYDHKNEAMIMLMDAEGSKMSIAYNWADAIAYAEKMSQSEELEEEYDWESLEEWQGYRRIGTKTIAGYKAEGYELDNEDAVIEVWVTREETGGIESIFGANANNKQLKGKMPEGYPYGMMLELHSRSKKGSERMTMRVTEINKNANVSYSMSDYPIVTMPARSN